ncbi:MAG: hypothetical protein HOY71_15740, partial [Nonomuraea sp.]|nr:hypothetical protein [Nonomuraea sp.]
MRRSRRLAAAVSALAVAAGALVSVAVIGVGPARADHCDPATQGSESASPTARARSTQPPDDQADTPDDQAATPDDQAAPPDD